jgi:hypothetical protein
MPMFDRCHRGSVGWKYKDDRDLKDFSFGKDEVKYYEPDLLSRPNLNQTREERNDQSTSLVVVYPVDRSVSATILDQSIDIDQSELIDLN